MGGSVSKTSIAAPEIEPLLSASAKSCEFTTGPRASLIRYAVGFI